MLKCTLLLFICFEIDALHFAEDSNIPLLIENDNAEPLEVKKGSNFTYECRVIKPEAQTRLMLFAWARYRGTDEENNVLFDDVQYSSTLTLVNVTEKDEDQWVCMVTNQRSLDYKVFNLTVVNDSGSTGTNNNPFTPANLC